MSCVDRVVLNDMSDRGQAADNDSDAGWGYVEGRGENDDRKEQRSIAVGGKEELL